MVLQDQGKPALGLLGIIALPTGAAWRCLVLIRCINRIEGMFLNGDNLIGFRETFP